MTERTDTERLDWLAANYFTVDHAPGEPVSLDWWPDVLAWSETLDAPTLRAAIDAAMDTEPEEAGDE